MNDELRSQIYSNMVLKETDELVEIWQKYDQNEWTEAAFEVVKTILQDRLGELPSQTELAEKSTSDDKIASDTDTMSELVEEESSTKRKLVCPNCKGVNLFLRNVAVSNSEQRVLLKKPDLYPENLFKDDEIIAIACKDCGFVFLMLKNYV